MACVDQTPDLAKLFTLPNDYGAVPSCDDTATTLKIALSTDTNRF